MYLTDWGAMCAVTGKNCNGIKLSTWNNVGKDDVNGGVCGMFCIF